MPKSPAALFGLIGHDGRPPSSKKKQAAEVASRREERPKQESFPPRRQLGKQLFWSALTLLIALLAVWLVVSGTAVFAAS